MARDTGTFDFSANFEVKKEGTLDARQLVDNFADLLNFTINDNFIPDGFTVAVKGVNTPTERGIYQCIDRNNLSNPDNWDKIGDFTVEPRTGVTIKFDNESIYGNVAPETGVLVLDNTDAVFGTVNLVIHNDTVSPFDGTNTEFKILTGVYEPNVDNYMYMQFIDNSRVLVHISQITV